MSSYQFVNTLAQCYAEQTGQGGVTGGGSQNPQDYYNMNYPNCYSPNLAAAAQQQYGQYSQLMMGGNNGGGGAGGQVGVSPGGMGGTADFGTNANNTNATNAGNTSTGQRGSANQSPSSSGLMPNNSGNNSSNNGGGGNNKFAASSAAAASGLGQAAVGSVLDGSLGSPQDLSRASDGETPQPSCQSMGGPKTPDSGPPMSPALTASSPGSTSKGHPESSSDRGGGSSGGGGGGSGSSKNGSSKSSSNSNGKDPPHIYPWMKRVHLGQSKSRLLFNLCFYFFGAQFDSGVDLRAKRRSSEHRID